MSTLALMAYSLGLLGFSLVKVLAPGFFARQDTQHAGAHRHAVARRQHGAQPRRRAAARAHRTTSPGLHALLALNNGIGAWYNATMLYRGLRRQRVLHHAPGWQRTAVCRSLVGNVADGCFPVVRSPATRSDWLGMRALAARRLG